MTGQMVSHYRIMRRLGAGGMGEVYLAEDITLRREMAIKFPSGNGASRQRLLREARLAAKLDHQNICQVYEAGEVGEIAFIAMQLITGKTLAEGLRKGPLAATLPIPKKSLRGRAAHSLTTEDNHGPTLAVDFYFLPAAWTTGFQHCSDGVAERQPAVHITNGRALRQRACGLDVCNRRDGRGYLRDSFCWCHCLPHALVYEFEV